MLRGNCLSFTPHQIDLMRKAGQLTAMARAYAGTLIQPGITTREIDREVEKFIKKHGGYPSFYHLYGFRGASCISVNDEIIHGVPGDYKLKEGDIVTVDVGACIGDYRLDAHKVAIGGYHSDCCATFACGEISSEAKRLIDVTEKSFWKGFAQAKPGARIFDIARAVQSYVEANGYSLVREYTGHGIGRSVHEEPEVPNYVPESGGKNERLLPTPGICIEPMGHAGKADIRNNWMPDGWVVPMTADHSLAVHYENAVLITENGAEILTRCEE